MTPSEREALATLCLMAAFADGAKGEAERTHLKTLFDELGSAFSLDLYQRALLGQTSIDDEATRLTTPGLRLLAYEMAVGVCDADGHANESEKNFLSELREALGLDPGTANPVDEAGDQLARLAETSPEPASTATDAPPGGTGDLDAMILRYAILNGGLELLPQSLATMAIVPLQTKMVYRIGRHHGYELDQGHVRELLATAGVGMTSQVVETYARRLAGGLVTSALGRKKGKKLKRVVGTAAGAALSFATTYALGQVADAYYRGGRQLSAVDRRALFERSLERGRALYATHRAEIEQTAQTTDLPALLTQLRSAV